MDLMKMESGNLRNFKQALLFLKSKLGFLHWHLYHPISITEDTLIDLRYASSSHNVSQNNY